MLYIADEVFFVGTAVEITPMRSVDKIQVGAGRRGPVTEAIQRRFLDIINGQGARHARLADVRVPEECAPDRRRQKALNTARLKIRYRGQMSLLSAPGFSMHIDDLLRVAVDKGASDLHLKVGSVPDDARLAAC